MPEETVNAEVTIKVIIQEETNNREQLIKDIQDSPTDIFQDYHRITDVSIQEF
ncbi:MULTISPECIES: hypothetical protein [Staphylococcus]|uniref:Uncharacterized protein n=2 Tax=Staphylococcus TaxID=1279 RepID=A0ABY1H0G7_9STAP|nr:MULTISPECIES: hypothetical protein [Staphylococcus]MCF7600844.1 hypothetical protein [Staphylococcus pasteuri]MDI3232659.1 hypothetical protein [Staphylococcus pasteuri]MDO6573015.1 hypothetical protein [Staphylococcus pasteuri_A]MEB6208120.1 hypothetical protein [Staphylococcus pasteuri]SFZ70801.1 hypothetical protein SAMN03097721_00004 [Staphylococcus pasteuri]